jgi:adenosine kinase
MFGSDVRIALNACLDTACTMQVITQGKEATVVAKDGAVTLYEVPAVPAEEIVDTNGAGDAFVGGFLAAFIKGQDIEHCCKAGNFAASTIIRTSGTALPATCDYEFAVAATKLEPALAMA